MQLDYAFGSPRYRVWELGEADLATVDTNEWIQRERTNVHIAYYDDQEFPRVALSLFRGSHLNLEGELHWFQWI